MLKRDLGTLLGQLRELQKLPSSKRKEENHKFVLKRFFKYIQKGEGGGRAGFLAVFRKYLAGHFDESEIDKFFKQTKEQKADPATGVRKKAYFIPYKLNHAFLKRLFAVKPLMERLLFYMDNVLIGQVKEEIQSKSLKFMSQFKSIYEQTGDYEIFSDTIMNYAIDCNHKNLWSVGEVASVVSDLKLRIEGAKVPQSAEEREARDQESETQ